MHPSINREHVRPMDGGTGEGDVVKLLRERTPLVDDPVGRTMVRTRIDQMAAQSQHRGMPWRRTAMAMAPTVLIAVALVASLFRSEGTVVPPIATATAAAAAVVAAVPANPAPPGIARLPRQLPPTRPSMVYQPYSPPGTRPTNTLRPARPEVQLPNQAQAAIILRQAPAPGALALVQEMQRRQYSG